MAKLIAKNVSVEYLTKSARQPTTVIEDVSFEVEEGELVAIIGKSGCGKTTLLNAIAGLLPIASGNLLLDGKEIRKPGRDRAMVFQSPALMPWRTVIRNVTYGLELQGYKRENARTRAQRYIHLVGLYGFEERFPHELSGGMQQRVNLARALAIEPSLLLLDEPFSSLDAFTRESMQFELQKIWQETQHTAIYVTHQLDEAVYLADKIIVMSTCPARIKKIVPIELPRPRSLQVKRQPQFYEIELFIWELLRDELY